MLKPITSSETIEIKVKDLINKIYMFPENLKLYKKKIKYFLSILPSTYVTSPLNRNLVGASNILAFQASYLTLVKRGIQQVNKIPLSHLTSNEYGGNGVVDLFEYDGEIDFPKSFVEISDLTYYSISESFLFIALYNDLRKPSETIDLRGVHVETVEIPITQNGPLKYYFPDNERLRHKKIVKIELSSSETPGVLTPINKKYQQLNFFLTLNIGNKERINMLPAHLLKRSYSLENQLCFDHCIVDFPKSYVTLPTAQTLANVAVCLQIYYKD